ncbi:DUF1853 family protein [Motiliproteus sediminis]|uniref:DUF1853 family protein n=1 Tax=Motiliproteus sediminis TaxID=1468178 RepID=UPI001AEF4625|nr:DUF1853 family protein [Motiliproteus sediminis]
MVRRPDLFRQADADLNWLVTTPPLALLGDPLPPWITSLAEITPSYRRLHAAQNGATMLPLGRYAELLLGDALDAHPGIAECLTNRVVRDGRQTVGEFDFLIRPKGCRDFHLLEFAVKFYLGLPARAGVHAPAPRWLGLNPRDSLEQKLERMARHQLLLPDHPASREQLQQRGVRIVARSGWIAGILFYPTLADDAMPTPPPAVHAGHQRGWWAKASSWVPQQEVTINHLSHRHQWLAGACIEDETSVDKIRTYAAEKPRMLRCRPIAAHTENGASERAVLVPDHWPGTA